MLFLVLNEIMSRVFSAKTVEIERYIKFQPDQTRNNVHA